MAQALFHFLSRFFAHYGYAAVFLGVCLENLGLPLPGETVLLFGAFVAHQGGLQLKWVIVTAMAGATAGGTLGYTFGYQAGPQLAELLRGRWFMSERRFDQAEIAFLKHGFWTVFVARFLAGLRMLAGPLAGAFRMRFGPFSLANAAGAIVWAVTISAAGYALGSSWQRLERFARDLNWIVFGAVLLLVVASVLRRYARSKQ